MTDQEEGQRTEERCCEAYEDACSRGFIREEGEHAWLADLESGSSGKPGYRRTFAPEIAFCPFCGAALELIS